MDDLIAIYAITITFELILSIVMALILLMVFAPVGSDEAPMHTRTDHSVWPATRLSPDLNIALRDAFRAVSEGRSNVSTLVHARHLLVQYADAATE